MAVEVQVLEKTMTEKKNKKPNDVSTESGVRLYYLDEDPDYVRVYSKSAKYAVKVSRGEAKELEDSLHAFRHYEPPPQPWIPEPGQRFMFASVGEGLIRFPVAVVFMRLLNDLPRHPYGIFNTVRLTGYQAGLVSYTDFSGVPYSPLLQPAPLP